VSQGSLDTTDEGDLDADGFNEAQGCYVLKAGTVGTSFVLHGEKVPRLCPVFKIKAWTGPAPKTIVLGQRTLSAGPDFLASTHDGVLLVQLLKAIRDDVVIVVH
jgi:hypothetical protein